MPSSRLPRAAALLLWASACAHVRRPPEEGWPAELDFRRMRRARCSRP